MVFNLKLLLVQLFVIRIEELNIAKQSFISIIFCGQKDSDIFLKCI